MIEKWLFSFLSTDPAVAAMVFSEGRYRIFPMAIPQKEPGVAQMPCVVYTITGETRPKTYCGTSRVVASSVAVDCYAPTSLAARSLATAVRGAMIDYRGQTGGMVVRDVTLASSQTLLDMDPGLMRVADSYLIWYEEE